MELAMRRNRLWLLLLAVVAGTMIFAGAQPASAQPPPPGDVITSAWSVNPVVIDGIQTTPNEWADANVYSIAFYNGGVVIEHADLWVKNDADSLYLKWEKLSGETNPAYTVFLLDVFFDQNNNGVLETPEDGLTVSNFMPGTFADYYWEGTFWKYDVLAGGTSDGVYAATGPLPLYREMMIPLHSGDPFDMNVVPGDTVGIEFYAWSSDPSLTNPPFTSYWWPQSAFAFDASTFGDLVLALDPPPGVPMGGGIVEGIAVSSGSSSLPFIIAGGMAAVLTLMGGGWYARRRQLLRRRY